jgi:DNA-binding HxlR family transcriptional regulator
MQPKRTYDDPCGVARSLDLVGERWALLVVRELLFGPKRFTELRHGLGTISETVLSQRLRELDGASIVRRRRSGPPASAPVYELTERGAELEPVVLSLAQWGSRTPIVSHAEFSPDALILALRASFEPAQAEGLQARVELRLAGDRFCAEVGDGGFSAVRGSAPQPDVLFETDVTTLRDLIYGGRSLDEALSSGDLALEGDRQLAARFLTCFRRPRTK